MAEEVSQLYIEFTTNPNNHEMRKAWMLSILDLFEADREHDAVLEVMNSMDHIAHAINSFQNDFREEEMGRLPELVLYAFRRIVTKSDNDNLIILQARLIEKAHLLSKTVNHQKLQMQCLLVDFTSICFRTSRFMRLVKIHICKSRLNDILQNLEDILVDMVATHHARAYLASATKITLVLKRMKFVGNAGTEFYRGVGYGIAPLVPTSNGHCAIQIANYIKFLDPQWEQPGFYNEGVIDVAYSMIDEKEKEWSRETRLHCSGCGKVEADRARFQKCGGCLLAYYCSRKCQKAHRKRHKKECKKWKNEREELNKTFENSD